MYELRASASADGSEGARLAVQAFAASLVHELRTPLSALAGEVDLALRRDRSPAAYREALTRVAQQAAELSDLTDDLALLGDPERMRALSSETTDLCELTTQLSMRYALAQVRVAIAPRHVRVAGHPALLIRAFRLVLDHAVRHHAHELPVRLGPAHGGASPPDAALLILDAPVPGFSPRTWHHLTEDATDLERMDRPGLLRLRTASGIVHLSGGTLTADSSGGAVRLRIHLRQVW